MKNIKEKPCHVLKYCPYGILVEDFPLVHGKFSCKVFGHDCPAYTCAEDLSEMGLKKIKEEIAKRERKKCSLQLTQ